MEDHDTSFQAEKKNTGYKRKLMKFWVRVRHFIKLSEDTDVEATIKSITGSIEIKGVNIWVLALAIIVASVGLNVNSTAVIIGAMLISPLMAPINGIGLAVGIVDRELLKKSLYNLGIMVFISLLASFTYFLLSPLSDAQSELLARTRPTIFDVLIAFFGGMAGIIAISRKSQPFTVISGVAIATALMPPLCTAGYGLASAQWNYFFGAFYLFFINSFFIALATFIIVRYLKFPQKNYLDSTKSKLVKRSITIFSVIVIVPSVFIALNMVRETSFNSQVIKYVAEIQDSPYFQDIQIVNYKKSYERKQQTVTLSLVGKELSEEYINNLQHILNDKYGLKNAKLIIKQTGNVIDITTQSGLLQNLLEKKDKELAVKDSVIRKLQFQIDDMHSNSLLYKQIAKEMAVEYPTVSTFSISNLIYTNTQSLQNDTVPTLFVVANPPLSAQQEHNLLKWLKVRLNMSKLEIKK